MMFYCAVRSLLKFFLTIICRPQITDAAYINNFDSGAILVCNHAHMSDILFLVMSTKRKLHFVGKSELFRNPILNKAFRALGAFPINRKSADVKAIRRSIELINKKEIVVIFPEGKRHRDGQLHEFEKGASFVAIQCKSPVIPAYVNPRLIRMRARIDYGKPIDIPALAAAAEKADRIETVTSAIHAGVLALKQAQESRLNL